MARPHQLNPAETAMFAAEMARLPGEHQADVAMKWRERCIAVIQAQADPLVAGASIVAMGAYTAGMGWWDGDNEARRDSLVMAWRNQTAPALGIDTNTVKEPFQDVYNAQGQLVHKAEKDPRTFLRINKTLYPSLALLIGGGVAATYGAMRTSKMMMLPAIGGLGYNAGSMARDMAYRKRSAKQNGAAQQPSVPANGAAAGNGNAAGNGGAGNPYPGYPRAV
jgi:hypothetical protein